MASRTFFSTASTASRSKFWWMRPRTLAATALVMGGGYGVYQGYSRWRAWEKLLEEVDQFHTKSRRDLAGASIFLPLDKLSLMRAPQYDELRPYWQIQQQLTDFTEISNSYSREISEFSWINSMDYFGFKQRAKRAKTMLSTINQLIRLTDDVNATQYHLKRKLYPVAEKLIERAINQLIKNPQLNLITDYPGDEVLSRTLTHEVLLAHSYNLAAKIARGRNDLERSDNYYEQALALEPESLEIYASRIALWGDMAWDKQNPKPGKLDSFLSQTTTFEAAIQRFEQQKYALGLANISWILIRAYESQKDIDKKQALLLKAYELADKAVSLSGLMNGYEESKQNQLKKNGESINPLLFRGITAMALSKPEEALTDFLSGLKREPHHISLLRRNAMVLDDLKDIVAAYWAYQQARIQLRYEQQRSEVLMGPYKMWLDEIERKLPELEKKLQQQLNQPIWETTRIFVQYLINNRLSEAYGLLDKLPEEIETTKIKSTYQQWFTDHYRITTDKEVHSFTPKYQDDLLIRLGLYHQPSPRAFIDLSDIVYQTKAEQPTPVLPPQWEILGCSATMLPESRRSGYLAIACRHTMTGQIVFSHAGTDATEFADLATDLALAWGRGYEQLNWAREFTEQILTQEKNKGFLSPFIYHTGHSLGGAISSYLACVLNPVGRHYAVTFDNPSPYWALVDKTHIDLKKVLFKTEKVNDYRDFPITAFLTRPSFINTAGGPHLGQVFCIPIPIEQAKPLSDLTKQALTNQLTPIVKGWLRSWLEKTTGFSMNQAEELLNKVLHYRDLAMTSVAYHDKALIQRSFVSESALESKNVFKSSVETYAIESWPADIRAWLEFEEQLGSNPKERLNFSVGQAQAKVKSALLAATAISTDDMQAGFHEVLPLFMLPNKLSELLKKHLTKAGLNEEEKHLLDYFDKTLLSWLRLDANQKQILIQGPLNGWQISAYFRQQLYEANRLGEKYAFSQSLYPHLVKLEITAPTVKKHYGFFAPSPSLEENSKTEQVSAPTVIEDRLSR